MHMKGVRRMTFNKLVCLKAAHAHVIIEGFKFLQFQYLYLLYVLQSDLELKNTHIYAAKHNVTFVQFHHLYSAVYCR